MRYSIGASATVAVLAFGLSAAPTFAAPELPPVKIADSNAVAACATPGRMMSFLKATNGKLLPKFETVATEYMRNGEELGIRWDFAFFQMLLETDFLRYTGDVKPSQNNFAGLGATGGGARGESFKDVASGARAHLEHLLMYAGERIENPVATRTKNIQEWGVLTSWQKTIKGPMTFAQLAKQWAPTSRGYSTDIAAVAGRFFDGPCKQDDPQPELVAEARKGRAGATVAVAADVPASPSSSDVEEASKGEELARRALDGARSEGTPRTGLGGADIAKTAAKDKPPQDTAPTPALNILNSEKPVAKAPDAVTTTGSIETDKAATKSDPKKDAKTQLAAVTDSAKTGVKAATENSDTASSKCRVWTASFGGAKAVIIKAAAGATTNYTVLDVNDGAEKREAEAYISAYAKGGETVAEFPNQNDALNKAFELCPEG